jgi:hypothetical protein
MATAARRAKEREHGETTDGSTIRVAIARCQGLVGIDEAAAWTGHIYSCRSY